MAYSFKPKTDGELFEDELDNVKAGIPYEEAKEYALKHGFGENSNFNYGELTEDELDNVLAGVPYNQSSGRRR